MTLGFMFRTSESVEDNGDVDEHGDGNEYNQRYDGGGCSTAASKSSQFDLNDVHKS